MYARLSSIIIPVLVLEGFLNSAFVISPRKKAPTSHFYSLQLVEKGREKNYIIRGYSFKIE